MGKVRRFATRCIQNVPLIFEDENGTRVTEKFTVTYRSYSQRALDEIAAAEEEAEAKQKEKTGEAIVISYAAYLAHLVTRIVDADGEDLTNENGEKQELNREFFDSLSIADGTKVIWDRIQEDINPPLASSEPGPSGSEKTERPA